MGDANCTNILVVDDLPEKQLVYRTILEELDQNVIMASSGPEALKQVLRHQFAVILLDVAMPGMDGFETAALIRKRRRSAHTPIIFVTAFPDDMRAAEGYARGAVDYITTPVVPEILRAKVNVFVDLFRMTEQVRHQADERIALAEERSRRAAAEEANRRLRFVATAGAVLGQSLDYAITARDVARLPVPFLADYAALVLLERGGTAEHIILARDQDGETILEQRTDRQDLPVALNQEISRFLASAAGSGREGFSTGTILIQPLQAHDRMIATLALARIPGRPEFDLDEQTMAHDLAARAAIALDNARLHEELRQADRQKNEFLSMLAHELRNPLAPIRNAVNLMRLRSSDHPQSQWARDVIERQVDHMVRLVDDLLDISRVTRGKIQLQMKPVELTAVLAQAVEATRPLIETRGHQLELAMPPEPVWVHGDSARLVQIVTNLLNNAAKYTEEGGRIWVRLTREGEEAIFGIRDNGVGIAPEMLVAVFELFTQVDRSLDRSEGGLGIGLTLVRRLVEMHGGCVHATSAGPGQGSEFTVRLPALSIDAPVPAPPNGTALAWTQGTAKRILVVDDNADAAESLALLLRLAGFETQVSLDGEQALRTASEWRPDVVLLDIGLPGMDGYEVARRLRAGSSAQDAVLIALTGYGQTDDQSRAQAAGFHFHLIKPVDFDRLRTLLASLPARAASTGAKAAAAR